jgi:hypothetical protein
LSDAAKVAVSSGRLAEARSSDAAKVAVASGRLGEARSSDAANVAVSSGRLGEALLAFRQETLLGAEHRRLMDSAHRTVPWERSGAADLPAELRVGLADLWRGRMVSEHRSVGIFSLYTLDLLGAGAPAEVLSLACRAALDEVRHAELFARLTSLYSGLEETPPPGISPMPDDPGVPMSHQVAREALHLCICSETYSTALLGELHARAVDPVVHAALGVVLADEIFHARMGWTFLATLLGGPESAAIREVAQAELVPMFDTFCADLFGDPASLPAPSLQGRERELAEAHGWAPVCDEYAIFRAAIDEVWIPGLAGLGLSPAALKGRYPEAPRG